MEYTGNVRIGNWQENEIIDKIGHYDFRDRSTQILTGKRVIEHDDKVLPKDYTSTVRSTYPNPSDLPSTYMKNQVGPRRAARDQFLRKQIDEEFSAREAIRKEEESKREFHSTARTAMAATGFVPQAERVRESRFQTKNADYATETAITYYSHTLENSKDLNFPVTLVTNLKNPWSKVSQVSEDLGNGIKRVRENWEHPNPLPSLAEVKILKEVQKKVLNAFSGNGLPGSRVREIFSFLLTFDKDGKGWCYVEDVVRALNEHYNVLLSPEDKLSLLRAFDHDRCHGIPPGRMRIREFMDLIRSPLSPRKQEIVEIVFNKIDSTRSGFITADDIVSRWRGSESSLDSLFQSLELYNGNGANLMQSIELRNDSYGVRVFSIFYKDFVTEYGDDTELFENFIEECWNLD